MSNYCIHMIDGIAVIIDNTTKREVGAHDILKHISNLEKELETEKTKKLKDVERIRAIRGLGGVMQSISLEHLFMMSALIGIVSKKDPIMLDLEEAVTIGKHMNELVKILEEGRKKTC